jgi:hypothetical protein
MSDPAYGYTEKRVHDSKHEDYSPYSELSLPIDGFPESI